MIATGLLTFNHTPGYVRQPSSIDTCSFDYLGKDAKYEKSIKWKRIPIETSQMQGLHNVLGFYFGLIMFLNKSQISLIYKKSLISSPEP